MPLKPASRPVVAALLIGLTKGAAALSSPASSASSPPPIVLRTPIFSLSLDPGSCQATADYLKHPRMTSTAAPFVSFYNRVADNRATNLDSCVSVSVVAAADHQQQQSGVGDELTVLRVTAAHGAGTVDISVRPGPEHLIFQIENLSNWTGADPVERHIAFGEFWTGMPGMDAVSNPPVMGKLQGPFGTPGSNATVAAGFMSISNSTYYRYIFYATKGQRLAFAICPTLDVAKTWIAVGKSQGIEMMDNPNRHKTWWWSAWTEANREAYAQRAKTMGVDILVNTGVWHAPSEELTISDAAFPSGINATSRFFASHGLDVGLHMHPDIVWPCVGSEGVECFETGSGISPAYLNCPECMVPEGLAPTFRSGMPPVHYSGVGMDETDSSSSASVAAITEDLGFWWGHDKSGTIARIGNPKPCGQGTCNRNDWAKPWGANMTLVGCHWSKLGVYRDGGAIGFNGTGSYGVVPHVPEFSTARKAMTLGLVLHLSDSSIQGFSQRQCIATKAGVFSLCLESFGSGKTPTHKLVWAVRSSGGIWCNATSDSDISAAIPLRIKATFNASAGSGAKLFLNGQLVGHSPCAENVVLASSESDIIFGAESVSTHSLRNGSSTTPVQPHSVRDELTGAVEEIYFKNASTENRNAYLFADDNRKMGTFLIDLSRAPGRALFAKGINGVLNKFDPAAVQYDGFEKLQLIAGQDFDHSSKTFSSGLWRGNPTPDWYHYEGWPLRWGIGILQGIEAAHKGMNSNTAVECSFMAPGLGPWRPDMAPYVDEHGPDLVKLGLEWHSKMLLRIEIAGTIINSYLLRYDTYTRWFETEGTFPIDYFMGGLVTGGLAFQPSGTMDSAVKFDAQIGRWMSRYKRYGHAVEDGVRTLVYDDQCCHIQGVCEWVACRDVVLSRHAGGTEGATVAGLYVGAARANAIVPSEYLSHNGTLLVFLAYNISTAEIALGTPRDKTVTVVPTAATNLTGHRALQLTGGFWKLEAEDVLMTIADESGTTQQSHRLFGKPLSGQQRYHLLLNHTAPSGSLRITFNKVK